MKIPHRRAARQLLLCYLICSASHATSFYVSSSLGNDENSGLKPESAWKSLDMVSRAHLSPGDTILLARGDTWEEKLDILASGTSARPIRLLAYGKGDRPLIKTSNTFSDWELVVDDGSIKVWGGHVRGVRNSWFATDGDRRLPKYFGYPEDANDYGAPDSLRDMQSGFFYAPLNSGRFYIRSDRGNPGPLEIGARPYGLRILNQQNVIVGDLAFAGGGGNNENKSMTGTAHVLIDNSSHIVLQNLSSSNNNMGVRVINGSTRTTITGLSAYGHRSTAVYFWKAGPHNAIEDCNLSNSGTIISDTGDMGFVGVFQSPYTTVRRCTVSTNGHNRAKIIDAAISFVRSPYGNVHDNQINDSGGTAIMFAVNSDFGTATNNTIDGWCSKSAAIPEKQHCEGIRIGGGLPGTTAENISVSFNKIINREPLNGNRAALKIMDRPTTGFKFYRNEIISMEGNYLVYAESASEIASWNFSNNAYHTRGENTPAYRIGDREFTLSEISDSDRRIGAGFSLEQKSDFIGE